MRAGPASHAQPGPAVIPATLAHVPPHSSPPHPQLPAHPCETPLQHHPPSRRSNHESGVGAAGTQGHRTREQGEKTRSCPYGTGVQGEKGESGPRQPGDGRKREHRTHTESWCRTGAPGPGRGSRTGPRTRAGTEARLQGRKGDGSPEDTHLESGKKPSGLVGRSAGIQPRASAAPSPREGRTSQGRGRTDDQHPPDSPARAGSGNLSRVDTRG